MIKRDNIVSVIGGSGFLGTAIVKQLAKMGVTVKVGCRHPARAGHLKTCGAVGQVMPVSCDIKSEKSLEEFIAGSDYVINLVGLLYSKGRQNFQLCHREGAKNMAKIAKKHGVKRLIHISALGVDKATDSEYATTKLAAEQEISKAFPNATIVRPSVVFGPDDNFINMFAKITKFSPIFPLINNGKTKLQPVYVDDVAQLVAACLLDESSAGKTLEVAGPEVYTLKQLIEYILKITKRKRLLVAMPNFIANIQGFVAERLPKPPLTRDQIRLLKYDNVLTSENALLDYGINPTSMESVVPRYLLK